MIMRRTCPDAFELGNANPDLRETLIIFEFDIIVSHPLHLLLWRAAWNRGRRATISVLISTMALARLRLFGRSRLDDRSRQASRVHLADEVLDHLLRDFEVGDDAIAQGPDGRDVGGRAASIIFASSPTASTCLGRLYWAMAMTDGSFNTMPRPLT